MTDPQVRTDPSRRSVRRLLRPGVILPALVLAGLLAGVAAYLFQPWKLWVDEVVDEQLPGGVGAPPQQPQSPRDQDHGTSTTQVLATGRFVSHEHATTGTVRVLRLPDGSRLLRIENLDTSNGPALKVWITDAPVRRGREGWHVFDDGQYVDLGALKGNIGSQNYRLPPVVDLAELRSVSIWCDRFDVSFGAAALAEHRPGIPLQPSQ